jgi:hypothetical protein
MGLSPTKNSSTGNGNGRGNNNGDNSQYIDNKSTDSQARFEKAENDIVSIKSDIVKINSRLENIDKRINTMLMSIIAVMVALFMLQTNFLNKILDSKSDLLVLQSKQFDERLNFQNQQYNERFDAQNQQYNDKFANIMEANDKTYQLALDALKKVNEPVSPR